MRCDCHIQQDLFLMEKKEETLQNKHFRYLEKKKEKLTVDDRFPNNKFSHINATTIPGQEKSHCGYR